MIEIVKMELRAIIIIARATCYETTKLLVEKTNLNPDKTVTSFQSRLDSKWVKPFSDKVLEQFADEGVKKGSCSFSLFYRRLSRDYY